MSRYAALLERLVSHTESREDGLRAPEVCRRVGITYRQLDYWTNTGLVSPSVYDPGEDHKRASGYQRLYSEHDVECLQVVVALLRHGMSLQRVRRYDHKTRTRLLAAMTEVLG